MADGVWTKEEVLEAAADVRKTARELFEQFGQVRPVTWLYATRNPETGEEGGRDLIVVPNVGTFNFEEQDTYEAVIQLVAKATRAVGIIFVSETWSIDPVYLRELGPERGMQELREWKSRSLSEHPRRIERVMILLEHHRLQGHMTWLAPITRQGDKGILGEWQGGLMKHGTGRFLRMLPVVH